MPKRIAVTVAGAVSLGSYEAGVLYELLQAIRTNNEAATGEDSKIYIDVLTGASAGGMTAAILSQRLMYDAASLEGETANVLYQAWVEQISLLGLARMHRKERKWHSLFSSDLIDSIGRATLVGAMLKKGSGPHAAVETVAGVPQTLRVGLALTNLDGIDYMLPIEGSKEGGFNYTSSLDDKLFDVEPDGQADAAKWEEMCAAAVGSGAFPTAFRAKAVEHAVEEYGEALPKDRSLWEQGKTYVDWRSKKSPAPFAHSDGGVLQNQPLGIAKNLVDLAVARRESRDGQAAHCDSADRLYVFVTPHSVKSSAQFLDASRLTIWDELKHLVRVYLRQAAFHDWITAETINRKVMVLDTRADQLAAAILQGKVDVATLAKASGELNAMLMADEEQRRLARLREQYSVNYDAVLASAGDAAANAFLSTIATLEAAAHLEERDSMQIIAVIADAQRELAGAGFAAFVGFCKKSFRQHDYWVGRTRTREYLQRADVKKVLGVTTWPQEKEWQAPLPNPTNVTLPLGRFEVLRAAMVPLLLMIAIRPVLLVASCALAVALGFGLWRLVHGLLCHFHLAG